MSYNVVPKIGILVKRKNSNEILLIKEKNDEKTGWGIVKGTIEINEQPGETLKRELLEEVGVTDFDNKIPLDPFFYKEGKLLLPFFVEIHGFNLENTVKIIGEEILEVKWFKVDNLPDNWLSEYQLDLVNRNLDLFKV
jgi:8-oxo-dGTP pyrophosphatase MutT (NUDIX family)